MQTIYPPPVPPAPPKRPIAWQFGEKPRGDLSTYTQTAAGWAGLKCNLRLSGPEDCAGYFAVVPGSATGWQTECRIAFAAPGYWRIQSHVTGKGSSSSARIVVGIFDGGGTQELSTGCALSGANLQTVTADAELVLHTDDYPSVCIGTLFNGVKSLGGNLTYVTIEYLGE